MRIVDRYKRHSRIPYEVLTNTWTSFHVFLAPEQPGNPIYVANGNEQANLAELVRANPPVGGMAAYITDMDGADRAVLANDNEEDAA